MKYMYIYVPYCLLLKGYMSDPWEIPGLAHFCEHMLFLGTEKVSGIKWVPANFAGWKY